MSVKNKTNKNYKRSQKGRSMVEMLGVLAIIGILSVGGLYGYGVAMKKHKANELLHQASMLATTISSQILTDKPLNVQDFGGGSANFSETVGTPNDEQFTLEIKEVDSSVCEQLKKMKGGMTRDITCGTADANGKTTATLKFNNNLSSEPIAGDFTTESECKGAGKTWCSGKGGSGACSNSTDCCAGITLTPCQVSCNSETGEITKVVCEDSSARCVNGECTTDWWDGDGCAITQELCSESPNTDCRWYNNSCTMHWADWSGRVCAYTQELCPESPNTDCRWIDNKCQMWYDPDTKCAITQELCPESPNTHCRWYKNACVTSDPDTGCGFTQEGCSESPNSECRWYNNSCTTDWWGNDGCAYTQELCPESPNTNCRWIDNKCQMWFYNNGCAITQELCPESPNSACSWNGTACVPG